MHPGAQPPFDKVRLLVEGFEGLRSGAKYMLLGLIFWVAGLLLVILVLLSGGLGGSSGTVLGLIVIIIGAVIGLYGLVRWMNGGKRFREFDEDLRYGELGPKYMLYSIPLLVLALLLLAGGIVIESALELIMGYILLVVSGIIALIGYILFGIFLLKLDNLRIDGVRMPDFNIDAILWFIGLLFSVLSIVAVILIHMHSNAAIERITSARYRAGIRVG